MEGFQTPADGLPLCVAVVAADGLSLTRTGPRRFDGVLLLREMERCCSAAGLSTPTSSALSNVQVSLERKAHSLPSPLSSHRRAPSPFPCTACAAMCSPLPISAEGMGLSLSLSRKIEPVNWRRWSPLKIEWRTNWNNAGAASDIATGAVTRAWKNFPGRWAVETGSVVIFVVFTVRSR